MLRGLYALQKDLGMDKSYRLIASSALFSIILFFYMLNIASFLQPTVYPLIDRITYITGFVDKHFVNSLFDSFLIIVCTILWFHFSLTKNKKYFIMAGFGISFLLVLYLNMDFERKLLVLITFPTILLLIISKKILKRNIVSFDWRLSVNYISLFGIAIAILSALVITSHILLPELSLPSLNYLYYFFIILSVFSPIYLVLLSFSYPFVLTFRTILKKCRKSSTNKKPDNIVVKKKYIKQRTRVFHLSIIIFLSIVISMIPHLNTVNKDNESIGVDTKYYVKFLESMANSSGYDELLLKAFVTVSGGDRPLSVLFFFLLSSIFYQGNFYPLLENLPLLLGPLLVIVTYFLALTITKDHLTSLFASLITIPSHVLIGIYAGFYANWFSLIWGYLAILFIFKIMDEPKKIINFIVFSILLIILFFSHAQTWTIYMYVIGLFLVVIFFLNKRRDKKTVIYIFLSMLPSIIVDIVRMLLINNSGVNQELNFALQREVGIHGIYTIWQNLIATTHFTLAGQIANPVILLLTVYWLYRTEIKEKYSIFFIIFFSLFALPLLFGDRQIQSRFFYEIPFQIPAAIALMGLK